MGRGAGIVVLLLEQAGPTSSCGEGSRLGTAGEGGLLGKLSGNYGQAGNDIPKGEKSLLGKMRKQDRWSVLDHKKIDGDWTSPALWI